MDLALRILAKDLDTNKVSTSAYLIGRSSINQERGIDLTKPVNEEIFFNTLTAQLKLNPEDSKQMFNIFDSGKQGSGKFY